MQENNVSHYNKLFWMLFIIIVIWNILSLPYSPLAWYDEVFFSSISHSLSIGNGYSFEIDTEEPLYIYGPVYFVLTLIPITIGGFGIFTYRIVNLFFSFLCILLLGRILRGLKLSEIMIQFLQLFLFTDTLITSNAHSGRMEFVALFFVLAAYYFYIINNRWTSTLISLMLTIAVLTTPRVVFIAIPLAITEFVDIARNKNWTYLFIYGFIPVLSYLVWIYASYGSIDAFVAYFTKPNDFTQNQSLIERFIGGNFFIPKWNYLLIFASILVCLHSIFRHYFSSIAIYFFPIVLFYLFITDTGLYSVYILPFYIIILGVGIIKITQEEKLLKRVIWGLLSLSFSINIGIYTFKVLTVLGTRDSRNPYYVSSWLSNQVPEGSRIIGSCAYYYAAIDNNCRFKKMFRDYVDSDIYCKELKKQFNPQYMFILNNDKPEVFSNAKNFNSELIGHYKPLINDNFITRLAGRFTDSFSSSYEGYLYKINSEE